jgi:chromosome segregation ATPase
MTQAELEKWSNVYNDAIEKYANVDARPENYEAQMQTLRERIGRLKGKLEYVHIWHLNIYDLGT